ncbi:hypothetical protein TNCV_3758191 [Trichonephila clavipes]|nr:hypothetical protein TNCV_3758191 [Trichonephila clavipes]
MGNSFHATSSLRHTSLTVLVGEGWQASLSATHDQMFSVDDKSANQGRGYLADFKDRTQPLDVRCQK